MKKQTSNDVLNVVLMPIINIYSKMEDVCTVVMNNLNSMELINAKRSVK